MALAFLSGGAVVSSEADRLDVLGGISIALGSLVEIVLMTELIGYVKLSNKQIHYFTLLKSSVFITR